MSQVALSLVLVKNPSLDKGKWLLTVVPNTNEFLRSIFGSIVEILSTAKKKCVVAQEQASFISVMGHRTVSHTTRNRMSRSFFISTTFYTMRIPENAP